MNNMSGIASGNGIKRISKGQIKAIRTIQSKLHIDEETRRLQLAQYGVEHTTDLSFRQAGDLITRLTETARQSGLIKKINSRKYYGTGRRGEDHTSANITQLQAIRILLLQKFLAWDKNHTISFMIRQTGKVKAVQMLTISEAKKVIIGMQRVFAGAVIKAMDPASLDNDIIESKRELYQRVNSASNEELEMIYKHSQTNGKMND